MLASTFAGMLAGFGLFFVGVWTLTENLKSLSGRSLRQAVLKYTRHPVQGFFWGGLVGAVAQSLAGVVFILVGLISAGILTMRAAIPVLAGANFGSSLLVFLSTINLEVAVMVILGVSGIALTQIDRAWLKPIMHGLFGLGLLFLGIDFIQTNAAPLVDQPFVRSYLTDSGGSLALVFVVGVVFCFIAQSVGAVTILAISLAVAGVLSVDQTILTIYGANVGSGLVTLLLSAGVRGSVRQIAYLQIVLINFAGSALLVGLWWIETHMGVPMVKALLASLADDLPGQMAYLYLILSAPFIPALFVLPWLERFLARIAPPTRRETDGQPQFIIAVPPEDVDRGLQAAEREQNRLVTHLCVFFEIAGGEETGHTATSLNSSSATLATELDYYLDDLGAQPLTPEH
ncbi:MAG: Na/Pi cotransporter family protein [Rhodobacteraceae bacterium]|nr:MAG: Na/Pi cotransporter family protein [Paracoccaceae bacterium]